MSENLKITESSTTQLDISDLEATELERLGKLLVGKDGSRRDEEESDGDKEKSVIRCRKNPAGEYFVSISDRIGAIKLPNRTLVVEPKIPMKHFVHIAKHSIESPRVANEDLTLSQDNSFLNVISHWLVNSLNEVVEKGLLMDYKERNDELMLVRGKVNVQKTTRNFLSGKVKVDCNFEEFDIDNPLNRLLRAAARRVAGSTQIKDPDLKKEAARLVRHLDGVGNLERNDFRASIERRSRHYRDAIDLAKRVLSGIGTSIDIGSRYAQTFLIPTSDLIEAGLRKILHKEIYSVSPKGGSLLIQGDRVHTVKPDLLIDGGKITGDVKYKIGKDDWDSDDLGQATKFAAGYESNKALIITFAAPERPLSDWSLRFPKLEVRRLIWNTNTDPQKEQKRLIDEVKKLIPPSHIQSRVA